MVNFVIGALFLVALTVGVLAAFRAFKSNNLDGPLTLSRPKPKTKSEPPFITPAHFGTGYIKDSPQMPADNCRKEGSALYPIQPLYVNYGPWKGGECCSGTCDVAKFNSPP
jgi:hypothetical protein